MFHPTMCQLTDIHHGPFVSIGYVKRTVDLAGHEEAVGS